MWGLTAGMPEVSRFYGIVPHFHAEYGEHEALVNITTLAIIGWRVAATRLEHGDRVGLSASARTRRGVGEGEAAPAARPDSTAPVRVDLSGHRYTRSQESGTAPRIPL